MSGGLVLLSRQIARPEQVVALCQDRAYDHAVIGSVVVALLATVGLGMAGVTVYLWRPW